MSLAKEKEKTTKHVCDEQSKEREWWSTSHAWLIRNWLPQDHVDRHSMIILCLNNRFSLLFFQINPHDCALVGPIWIELLDLITLVFCFPKSHFKLKERDMSVLINNITTTDILNFVEEEDAESTCIQVEVH